MKFTVVKFLFILVIIAALLESGVVQANAKSAKAKKRSPLPQAGFAKTAKMAKMAKRAKTV
ncbi:276_t:CDS:2 [Paraglomus brasilianum]|uniref:276_t:CDS:1 n=1 Tax=Paraglomus brasilianum TaxID=144538 RepID=A0A9N9BNI6_9GLOM|nr:276_t:CDS:2 [Paraglomus brasilianum]